MLFSVCSAVTVDCHVPVLRGVCGMFFCYVRKNVILQCAIIERRDMGLYEMPLSMSVFGFGMGTMLANFHMCGIIFFLFAMLLWAPFYGGGVQQPFLRTPVDGIPPSNRNRGPLGEWCCWLPTPMTLASGGSPMFPLVVHQPASPSIWPAVQSLRRGLSTNRGVTMWCVCGCS